MYLIEILCLLPFGKYPEVELLDYMVDLFLNFWAALILFSTVVRQIHIPINSVEGLPFSYHILTSIYCLLSSWT